MYHFYGMLSRMKYIGRWGLMRNSRTETLSEHVLDVAIIAHGLGAIRNEMFGGDVDLGQLVLAAMYHDAGEILTGDMPTPVKYQNPAMVEAYKQLEQDADERLLCMLPPAMRAQIAPSFGGGEGEIHTLVKAADKLSALIKCIEEEKSGNCEFQHAKLAQERALREMALPEVAYFMEHLLPSYSLTLDELRDGR